MLRGAAAGFARHMRYIFSRTDHITSLSIDELSYIILLVQRRTFPGIPFAHDIARLALVCREACLLARPVSS